METSKTVVLQTSSRGGWQHSKVNNLLIKPLKIFQKLQHRLAKGIMKKEKNTDRL